MTDPARPPARLFTSWGTVLYIDLGSSELRHGPVETSPANALFIADPASSEERRGWLMHDTGDGLAPIVCLAEQAWSARSGKLGEEPGVPTNFEFIHLERGILGLRSGEFYLCAQPDGRLSLANKWCSTWECFLASEDWCTPPRDAGASREQRLASVSINWRGIAEWIVEPMHRVQSRNTAATKIVIWGHTQWSHGRVYYDVCKALTERGYVVDLLDWTVGQGWKIERLLSYYDFFLTALNGIGTLVDVYGVPADRIIGLSHHALDIRTLVGQMGVEVFERFAGYGVVGYQLFDASVILGVKRHPQVVHLGVNFDELRTEIPERLATVGYAGSFSQHSVDGIEMKRGVLAEAAVREAGLDFKVAGSTGAQISFHDMPAFYRSVDAILVSSVTEGAGLPAREGAAAGRLVISTPVGDFPVRAAQGLGILAPIEADKYKKFVADTLKHYKEDRATFADLCRKAQAAARQLDWQYMIGAWAELIEAAKAFALQQARAHQEAGRFAEAAALFKSRAERGGDAEEKWYARWQHARSLREQGNENGFVRTALAAFRERPSRAEPLHDLANYYLATSRAEPAALYAEAALAIPLPEHDVLSVDRGLYEFGLRHSYTVAASWSQDPELKERGRKVCDWLALSREVPAQFLEPARYNSGWFAASAESLMPSLQFHPLPVAAPEGFQAANIGICRYGDGFAATVRAVNYVLDDGFHITEIDDVPFRSRMLLLHLDRELAVTASSEAALPEDLPVLSSETLGFEDPRPFVWRDRLWCVASVRQLNAEARPEMVLARIDDSQPGSCVLTDWRVLESGLPPRWEKNWMPQVAGDELRFICTVDPTRVVTEAGAVLCDRPAPVDAAEFRGGSQAVPFDDGWLAVIHESEWVNELRRYFHRFVWFDRDNHLRRLSRRFYLRQLCYEFVAGMAWHPDGNRLVIGFSVHDTDPTLAVVTAGDIRGVLLGIDDHRRASEEVVAAGDPALEKIIDTTEDGGSQDADRQSDGQYMTNDPGESVNRTKALPIEQSPTGQSDGGSGSSHPDPEWRWRAHLASKLRYPFAGADTIKENYSQAWQDIFVLSILAGLRGGNYLEFGGQKPCLNNNTYLLCKHYGWRGVTLEQNPEYFLEWKLQRSQSTLVIVDALTINYVDALPKWFGRGQYRIDYLQLDIDPSLNTLAALKRLPLDAYRFSVITFETDAYTGDHRARDESRAVLTKYGYQLVAGDVSVYFPSVSVEPIPFEDWWVDPQVFGWDNIGKIKDINAMSRLPQNFLFTDDK